MTDDFANLFAYHRRADDLYLAACGGLTPEQYEATETFEVGWPSIRSLVVHIAGANDAWSRRLVGESLVRRPTEADLPTFEDAARMLVAAHERFATEVLPGLTPERLAAVWTYRNFAGTLAAAPLWAVLRHVVNHGTYHRGQLASKLNRRGVVPPITDLVFWAIEATPQPS